MKKRIIAWAVLLSVCAAALGLWCSAAAFTVHQCLHALEEPYKEVFSLRVFGELPFESIGAIFGHNAAWARVTYYRAKTRIQTMLEQQK